MKVEDIDEFLLAAYRLYVLKLTDASKTMYFYAWYDQQAGQLRTSAALANRPEELPFRSRLDVVELPTLVSEKFLNSNYLDGIPFSEFEELSTEDIEEDVDDGFELTVFARRILSLA